MLNKLRWRAALWNLLPEDPNFWSIFYSRLLSIFFSHVGFWTNFINILACVWWWVLWTITRVISSIFSVDSTNGAFSIFKNRLFSSIYIYMYKGKDRIYWLPIIFVLVITANVYTHLTFYLVVVIAPYTD